MKNAIEVGIYSHNLSVSFNEVFENENETQLNFFANLTGVLCKNDDDIEPVHVAHIEGTIASLPYRVGKGINRIFELEIGNHFYAYSALDPLYLANDCLSKKMWNKVGGNDYSTRVIYIDKVVVEKGFVSINLGAKFVIATMNLIYKLLQEEIPVIAILGSYDGFPSRGKSVAQYFRRYGFKKLKVKEELSHFLPISKIKTDSGIEDVKVFFSEQKKNKITKE